jgi:hypothetical protein
VSLQITILDDVTEEILDIWFWYEAQQTGLGDLFQQEFIKIAEHIRNYNESDVRHRKYFRQARLFRFPYFIMYELEDEAIVIYAILHTSRHPKRKNRKKN